LFISKSIIESHGGKMTAQNNNINGGLEKGAMFCFSLPIAKKIHELKRVNLSAIKK
jgi:signal transduction histidine kinase